MCMATSADGSPANVTSYHWTATNCYDHTNITDFCFYGGGKRGHNITGNNLLARDAGTVTCNAIIDSINYTSDPLTLRISGELGMHYIIFLAIAVS